MIAGTLINKFHGDPSLFDAGRAIIEERTGRPCLGVVPHFEGAGKLPAEDVLALEDAPAGGGDIVIAVPRLGRIANFDDLDPLKAEPEVEVVFVPPGQRLPSDAAVIVLPGSKATIADLGMLRENGWDRDLAARVREGRPVLGVCGGYQMLGRTVSDPHGIEGGGTVKGLGLLDVETVLEPEKTVRNVTAWSVIHDEPLSGYEIHLGRTSGPDALRPAVTIEGTPDGAVSADGRVWGTYLHGVFAADGFRRKMLEHLGVSGAGIDYRAGIEQALDAIAAHLERHLDVDALLAAAR